MSVGERALLCCAGGGIGDSLVASVVARALRGRFGVVDAVTLPGHRDALMHSRDVDTVLCDDGAAIGRLRDLLAARSYDAAVVTWATERIARALQAARIPVRVGQSRRFYSYRFTHRVDVRSECGDVTSPWVDVLLDYARALGASTDARIPSFEPTAADAHAAAAVLDRCGLAAARFVILNPCNAIASQRSHWPTGGWVRLARALAQRGSAVLVSGSPREAAIAARIASEAGEPRVRSVAGQLDIGGFGALAARAAAWIGITTGSMHVAAAVGTPTLGIFPFQSDFPDRWAPQGRAVAVVRPSFRCHTGDTKERCADYACIEALDVSQTLAALDRLLG